MSTQEVAEIRIANGAMIRIWQVGQTFSWATPNGSEGSGEPSFAVAEQEATEAEA